jgi:hypothetical protein
MNEVLTPPCRGKVRFSVRNRPKVPAPPVLEKVILKLAKPCVNGQLSGEKRFLYYAGSCLEMLMNQRTGSRRTRLSKEDVADLNDLMDNGGDPDHLFLAHCFPVPVSLFGEFAGIDSSLDVPWDIEHVGNFWHMHRGPTPVLCGKVEAVTNGHDLIVCVTIRLDNGLLVPALNKFKLPVSVGDIAYFHNHIVAEVERA